MLLLTVTTDTQGRRKTDSCTAIDGELVALAETTECDEFEPTSRYPRSFEGLSSGALTTTAVVRDVPLTEADLFLAIRGFLETHHRWRLDEDYDDDPDHRILIKRWAADLTAAGRAFGAGTVVERWWDTLSPRGAGPLRPERPPRRSRASWEG